MIWVPRTLRARALMQGPRKPNTKPGRTASGFQLRVRASAPALCSSQAAEWQLEEARFAEERKRREKD